MDDRCGRHVDATPMGDEQSAELGRTVTKGLGDGKTDRQYDARKAISEARCEPSTRQMWGRRCVGEREGTLRREKPGIDQV